MMALKTTSIVISLASEAGGIFSSGFLEKRTVPVSASIRKACLARVSNNWANAACDPRNRRQKAKTSDLLIVKNTDNAPYQNPTKEILALRSQRDQPR
ncbi:protein of unknown function [Nitratireductor aquimarinus]